MRKIDLQALENPIWKRWRADCEKAAAVLREQAEKGAPPEIGTLYRRKSIKQLFFFAKGPPFFAKCAYCEAPLIDYQHGDVEHFRPKGAVTDEVDRPVLLLDEDGQYRLDRDGSPLQHPGYYWLAYDWRNLLPSCVRCNQPAVISGKKIGKRNRFPVVGRHAQNPGEEEGEKPLLIHPASGRPEDDPVRHLLVDTKTGYVGHRSERGRACIEIFGLNVRDQLLEDRQRACREVWRLLADLAKPGGDPEAARELAEIQAGKKTFTMAQRAVLKEWRRNVAPILG